VASAKRALLTELLSSGRHHQFPKDTTGIVSRYIDKGIPDYVDIARAYDNKDWKVVREVSNRPAFAQVRCRC
jgi:COP9 signalosome complex subunit 3